MIILIVLSFVLKSVTSVLKLHFITEKESRFFEHGTLAADSIT